MIYRQSRNELCNVGWVAQNSDFTSAPGAFLCLSMRRGVSGIKFGEVGLGLITTLRRGGIDNEPF